MSEAVGRGGSCEQAVEQHYGAGQRGKAPALEGGGEEGEKKVSENEQQQEEATSVSVPLPHQAVAAMGKRNAVAIIDGVSYFGILETDPLHARASPDWLHRVLDRIETEYNLSIEMRHIFDALMDPSLHDFPSERKRTNTRRSLLRNMQQAHFRVHQRYVKPFRTNCQNPDCSYARHTIEIPVEAGVDVDITTFVLAYLPKRVDTILLWVKEPDYKPLLQVLDKRSDLHTYVVCDDFEHADLALKDAFEGSPAGVRSHFISLEEVHRFYPTTRPENIVVSEDIQRLETTMTLNKRFRNDIAQEYERTGSVARACSLTFLGDDDIQELEEEYGPELVKQALDDPECPRTYLEVVEFIEDMLPP